MLSKQWKHPFYKHYADFYKTIANEELPALETNNTETLERKRSK